jgi:hypothetical protein
MCGMLDDLELHGSKEGDTFLLRALAALTDEYWAGTDSTFDPIDRYKAMMEFGCMTLFMKQMGSVKDIDFSKNDPETAYVQGILPGVTVLGSQLLHVGTKQAQDEILVIFKKACRDISVEQRFFDGLKSVLRYIRDSLETSTDSYLILPNINLFCEHMLFQLSNFFNDYSEGFNLPTQEFLENQQNVKNVDLVTEIANVVDIVVRTFNSKIKYVEDNEFNEMIGGKLITNPRKCLRMIA